MQYSRPPAVLGLDLGTSQVKALLCTPDGTTLGQGTAAYQVSTPRPGWAEINPEHWWQATCIAVRAAVGPASAEVAGLAVAGQMHGLILCTERAVALPPAITWLDQRKSPSAPSIAWPWRAAFRAARVGGIIRAFQRDAVPRPRQGDRPTREEALDHASVPPTPVELQFVHRTSLGGQVRAHDHPGGQPPGCGDGFEDLRGGSADEELPIDREDVFRGHEGPFSHHMP